MVPLLTMTQHTPLRIKHRICYSSINRNQGRNTVIWEQGGEGIQHEVRGMFLTEVLAEDVHCEPATGFCDVARKPPMPTGPTA